MEGRTREERIRELAYLKWEAAGCPPGDGTNFWYEAEAAESDHAPHASRMLHPGEKPTKVAAKVSTKR